MSAPQKIAKAEDYRHKSMENLTSGCEEAVLAGNTPEGSNSSTDKNSPSSLATTLTNSNNSSGNASTSEPTKIHSIPFLNKLYTLLEDPSIEEYIHWSEDGSSFCIARPEDFAKTVCPQYFKHTNIASFVRQLNMYGFHKITEAGVQSDGSAYEFGHTSFKRGHPHLIQDIRRKTTKPSNTTVAAAESSKEKTANDASRESLEKYHKVTQETLNRLCGTVEQLQMRLEQMHESHIALWRECNSQKHMIYQQRQTIEKLLETLKDEGCSDPNVMKRKLEDAFPHPGNQ